MSTHTELTVALALELAQAATNHILEEAGIKHQLEFNLSSKELAKEIESILADAKAYRKERKN